MINKDYRYEDTYKYGQQYMFIANSRQSIWVYGQSEQWRYWLVGWRKNDHTMILRKGDVAGN